MKQEIAQYERRVVEEADSLQKLSGTTVAHGSEGDCPGCGHVGIFDLQGAGLTAGSIFFSTTLEKWLCPACDINALGY